MSNFPQIFGGPLLLASLTKAAEYDDMGPAAFMWPPDRVWAAAVDNTAPCGSVASAGNRTDFPMENGQVALVAQDESWEVELSISYEEDPQSNSDFTILIDGDFFREMDPGHTCVPVSDAPDSVTAGDHATLQVRYTADFDTSDNQTFYACADITFVETASFDTAVPCFNATVPDDEDGAGSDWDYHDDNGDDDESSSGEASPSASPISGSSSKESSSGSEGGSGSSDLSGGAIAGIVVGSVVAVALVAMGLVIYRRREQRFRARRQQQSSRGIKWDERFARGSGSTSAVRMDEL